MSGQRFSLTRTVWVCSEIFVRRQLYLQFILILCACISLFALPSVTQRMKTDACVTFRSPSGCACMCGPWSWSPISMFLTHTKKRIKMAVESVVTPRKSGHLGMCVTQTARLKSGLITSASEPILLPACKGQHVTCEAGSVHVVAHGEL